MSAGTEPTLVEALHRIAAQSRPAKLPADLWARGRRRHRRRVVAAATLIVMVALAALLPLTSGSRARPIPPAHDQPSVPSTVYAPLPFQSTVQDAPPGPATVLLTGPGGYGANDLTGYEDRALVVGATGQYRWLRGVNGFDAGESVLLSPDGRFVAGDGGVEGAPDDGGLIQDRTVVVDLSTGHARTFEAGYPLAWTPDGRSLITSQDNSLSLLSVESGAVVRTGIDRGFNPQASFAFSPDGHDMVMQAGGSLRIVDVTTRTQRVLAPVGSHRVLAGPGAWRADGRIAVWDNADCGCGFGATLHLSMSYVDSKLGGDVDGPRLDGFDGLGARLLGWRANGDAVVVRYQATSAFDERVDLVALRPGGGAQRLVDLPGGTNRVEIAAQLLDRFGGPSASLGYRLGDWMRTHADDLVGLVAVIAVVVVLGWLRRRWRRRRSFSPTRTTNPRPT